MKLKPHDRHPMPSGHGPTYLRDPKTGRVCKSVYICPCHAIQFDTIAMMRIHIKTFRQSIRRDFAELVRTGNLGQPAWARLPGETPLQYRRFMSYLNSLSATFKRSYEQTAITTGATHKAISTLGSVWHWRLRADLFDQHIEAEEFKQFEAQKRQSARRQAVVGRKLQDVALSAATRLLANDERLEEMSGNEIAKLADVGTKIERLANSDPTAISEDRGQVRLVWEGPRPTWAPAEAAEPRQIEATVGGS